MLMGLNILIESLILEAKSSPNLLADLAGLESYIAESYNNRSFIELLQNADDAFSSNFKIKRVGNYLFVANNGRPFNLQDLESLCRSASSKKVKNESIGYRGIGFKSVVGFANEVHLISGGFQITFSREKTKELLDSQKNVPLIRIPHQIDTKVFSETDQYIKELQNQNYKTIFIFNDFIGNRIAGEFENFKYTSLLFLRNIIYSEIDLSKKTVAYLNKDRLNEDEVQVSLRVNDEIQKWLLFKFKNSTIAFFKNLNQISRLEQQDGLIHAFLPTEDKSGLGVLLNGNFSTDPSRKHLIYDSETDEAIKECSQQIVNILFSNFKNSNKPSIEIVNAIIPYTDPNILKFSKNSFTTFLLEEIRNIVHKKNENIYIFPDWLNSKDLKELLPNQNEKLILDPLFNQLDNFIPFIKYLGARELNFIDIYLKINSSDISFLGCVQLSKFVFKSVLSYSNEIPKESLSELKIIHSGKKRISLKYLKDSSSQIDETFLRLLNENGISENDIKQVLKSFGISNHNAKDENFISKSPISISNLNSFKQELNDTEFKTNLETDLKNESDKINVQKITPSFKKWRSAEEQTLEILNLTGYKLEDVSKQNIGYDLSGLDPNGINIQIEIKSINYPGQKFKLTNNEVAVAQEKQKSYYVALVRQNHEQLEISLIQDPIKNLTLNRQCVQWIWECESYEYNPKIFELG